MTPKETVNIIIGLYNKYGVTNSSLHEMSEKKIISSMKGLLAELDEKKAFEYAAEDVEIIKDLFYYWC